MTSTCQGRSEEDPLGGRIVGLRISQRLACQANLRMRIDPSMLSDYYYYIVSLYPHKGNISGSAGSENALCNVALNKERSVAKDNDRGSVSMEPRNKVNHRFRR